MKSTVKQKFSKQNRKRFYKKMGKKARRTITGAVGAATVGRVGLGGGVARGDG